MPVLFGLVAFICLIPVIIIYLVSMITILIFGLFRGNKHQIDVYSTYRDTLKVDIKYNGHKLTLSEHNDHLFVPDIRGGDIPVGFLVNEILEIIAYKDSNYEVIFDTDTGVNYALKVALESKIAKKGLVNCCLLKSDKTEQTS